MYQLIISVIISSTTAAPVVENGPIKRGDFVRADLVGVVPSAEGYVMVLQSRASPQLYVPIVIGDQEAMNIKLHVMGETPPRPFTLNLLESIIDEYGLKIVEARIDKLVGGVFFSTLIITDANGIKKEIDCRPSDAMGLIAKYDAPIWINGKMLEQVGIDPNSVSSIEKDGPYEETL